jgi:membrane-associated phospholipid phosphatase
MNKTVCCVKQNLVFFISFLVALLVGFIFSFFAGKASSFILLNEYHSYWLNFFFLNYTYLGDGLAAVCLVLLFFFIARRKKVGLALLSSFILSGLVAQILKNIFHAPRPVTFFGGSQHSFFINGIKLACTNSFPSGHTATAFAIATVLVMTSRNRKWQLPVLLYALLVGFSRIYLGQHFLMDVVVGALVGTLSGMVCIYVVNSLEHKSRIFAEDVYFSPKLKAS